MSGSIIIGGDLCPIGRAETIMAAAGPLLDTALEREWFACGLRVVNLEAPLTREARPIHKTGPALKGSPDCLRGLKALQIDIMGMANNHILDYGERGLADTLDGAKAAALKTVGAGRNANEAARIITTEVDGVRIAVAAFAEHEWSIAGSHRGGANPWSAMGFVRMLAKHAGQYDRLIVLFHGGKEYYEYPPPALQERCRFMAEQGAHAVICQHSHCVGSHEVYRDCLIVYGQGNFIFDRTVRNQESWQTGMLVKLDLSSVPMIFEFIPYRQFDGHARVSAITGDARADFMRRLEARSRRLAEPGFVEQSWARFCEKQGPVLLTAVLGQGAFMRRLNRLIPINRYLYPRRNLRAVLNGIRCESLRETVQTYLENQDPG